MHTVIQVRYTVRIKLRDQKIWRNLTMQQVCFIALKFRKLITVVVFLSQEFCVHRFISKTVFTGIPE